MKGILHPDEVASLPAVARWLSYGEPALQRVPGGSEEENLKSLTRWNVVVQMEHLSTHPSVKQRLDAGDLRVHGWVYEIETGEVMGWDEKRREFLPWPE